MGDWQTGITESFKSGTFQQTRKDKQRIKKCLERNKQEKKALRRQTATYANKTYQNAALAVVHPYLSQKGIEAADGLKLDRDQLLIPLYDLVDEKVENLQRIFPDGTKRFLKNGRMTGLCCPYGLLKIQSIWPERLTKAFICEGYATAASIYQMTQQPVLAAMNTNNLLPVARRALQKWPGIELVIAGDDDYLTEQHTGINPGKAKANEAANLLSLEVSFPPFTIEHKRAGLTDWNDYYIATKKDIA
jgi:putative DNA primase/helicase